MKAASTPPPKPLPVGARVYQTTELVSLLAKRSQSLLTFLGFGELGYQDEEAMRSIVRAELETRAPADVIVNTGTLITDGFHIGIADVYREAKEMGFTTSGIHPSIALRDPARHSLSPFVDEIFFVEDDSWGGYLPGTEQASATLQVLVASSGQVIAIGGGRHAADELREFLDNGVPVYFYEADMNHGVGVRWYRKQGVLDVDFRGDAYQMWRSKRRRA